MYAYSHNAEMAADDSSISYISSMQIAFEPDGVSHGASNASFVEALSEIFCEEIDQLSIAV